jgi:hypothetical protein
MPISDLVVTVAQVRCFREGEQQGIASGFFYLHEENFYFIMCVVKGFGQQ